MDFVGKKTPLFLLIAPGFIFYIVISCEILFSCVIMNICFRTVRFLSVILV